MRESVGAWKWEEIQSKEKESWDAAKRINCDLVCFLFSSTILIIYCFLLLKKMMNYSCTISEVSMDSQDIYDKAFAIGNYNVHVLINGKLTKCDCNK